MFPLWLHVSSAINFPSLCWLYDERRNFSLYFVWVCALTISTHFVLYDTLTSSFLHLSLFVGRLMSVVSLSGIVTEEMVSVVSWATFVVWPWMFHLSSQMPVSEVDWDCCTAAIHLPDCRQSSMMLWHWFWLQKYDVMDTVHQRGNSDVDCSMELMVQLLHLTARRYWVEHIPLTKPEIT